MALQGRRHLPQVVGDVRVRQGFRVVAPVAQQVVHAVLATLDMFRSVLLHQIVEAGLGRGQDLSIFQVEDAVDLTTPFLGHFRPHCSEVVPEFAG